MTGHTNFPSQPPQGFLESISPGGVRDAEVEATKAEAFRLAQLDPLAATRFASAVAAGEIIGGLRKLAGIKSQAELNAEKTEDAQTEIAAILKQGLSPDDPKFFVAASQILFNKGLTADATRAVQIAQALSPKAKERFEIVSKKFKTDNKINPDVILQREIGTNKLFTLGGKEIKIENIVGGKQEAFEKEFGSSGAKAARKAQTEAAAAQDSISSIENTEIILEDFMASDPGFFTKPGFASEMRNNIAGFGELITRIPNADLASAQRLRAKLNALALVDIKKLGTRPTDKDMEILIATVGSMENTPDALRAIFFQNKYFAQVESARKNLLAEHLVDSKGNIKGFNKLWKAHREKGEEVEGSIAWGEKQSQIFKTSLAKISRLRVLQREGFPAAPQGAIDMLKQNPSQEMKDFFNLRFGPGSADAVLGG